MTLGETLGLSDQQERLITRGLQLALIGLIVYGIATIKLSVAVTGSFVLSVTLLPAWLNREFGYSMDPGLVLWITVAMVLHTVGTLGLYSQYQWYDEITHTVSATIIAGLGYATFRALELHSEEIDVSPEFRSLFIIIFVLAAGILWEVVEFAFGGLIPVYGIDDIVTDLVFNALGAIIVAIWGTGYVTKLTHFLGSQLRTTQTDK